METLSPFNQHARPNVITVLIVGSEGTGKYKLADALVKQEEVTESLEIRVATSLPLPAQGGEPRPKIDFVVIVGDLTNRLSLKNAENSFANLGVEYFLGQVCFVATKVTDPMRGVELGLINLLADAHNVPVLCGSLEVDADRASVASRIFSMAKIAAGYKHLVTPLVVNASRRHHKTTQISPD